MKWFESVTDFFFWHWKAMVVVAAIVAFSVYANLPNEPEPISVSPPPTTTTHTTLVSTTTTLSAELQAELDRSWEEFISTMPPPAPRRYARNQYGCHSDGRCLDENDVWCDEDDIGWISDDEWFCYASR